MIKERAEEIKEKKIQTSKEIFAFVFAFARCDIGSLGIYLFSRRITNKMIDST